MTAVESLVATPANQIDSGHILGMRVHATSYTHALNTILEWTNAGESRYVCASTVHMVMEAHDSEEFRKIVNSADLATPDGMPLVWTLKYFLGYPEQTRVYGPDLTLLVFEAAAARSIPIGFFGAQPDVLQRMISNAKSRYPGLTVVYDESPPFRPLTEEDHAKTIAAIRESGAKILFVGLGCPKQERWMHEMRGRIPAVMLGVGAAFDFVAGTTRQAPRWMMNSGLEWFFRVLIEPRRLWKRYFILNPRFVSLLLMQLTGIKRFD